MLMPIDRLLLKTSFPFIISKQQMVDQEYCVVVLETGEGAGVRSTSYQRCIYCLNNISGGVASISLSASLRARDSHLLALLTTRASHPHPSPHALTTPFPTLIQFFISRNHLLCLK